MSVLHRIKFPPQRTGPDVASDLGEWKCCADEVHTFYAPMVGLVVEIDADHTLHMFCEADQVDAAIAALRGGLAGDAPPADRLPELRGMFERILAVARSSGGRTVGNIELADRLIRAVEAWQGEVRS